MISSCFLFFFLSNGVCLLRSVTFRKFLETTKSLYVTKQEIIDILRGEEQWLRFVVFHLFSLSLSLSLSLCLCV